MIFDILLHAGWAPRLSGACVCDLYAGSGALGIEALSRGASCCMFVDQDVGAVAAIESNLCRMGLQDRSTVRLCRLKGLGGRPDNVAPMDLAFVDPPYRSDPQVALGVLSGGRWLDSEAVVVVETGRSASVPWSGYVIRDERKCGVAHIRFLVRRGEDG